MKESFSELYARLYNENFAELEEFRKKEKKSTIFVIIVIFSIFILSSINAIFLLLGIACIVIYGIKLNKENKNNLNPEKRPKSYKQVFKEKIVGPIIEISFGSAKYDAKAGISSHEYNKAGYKEHYDRYHSEDLIIAPLTVEGDVSTFMTIAEVHTENEHTDEDGHKSYTTVFQGLTSSFLLPKNTEKNIYIRSNGRVSSWNKSKVKMDMPEFEKIFDVESNDAILAMRVLTADVMAEMIDLYKKYKYRFEINILNDTIYMRLRTGPMFEPSIFKQSMEYKQIEKYYLVLKALTSIASHIYDTVAKIEI